MLPLLAAIPSIISAVSKVSDLFSSGKEAVKKVTGSDSIASTSTELQDEIQSLPKEQQAQWAQIMQQKVELYQAENQRLDIEIGRIDSNITSKLTPEAASKIALTADDSPMGGENDGALHFFPVLSHYHRSGTGYYKELVVVLDRCD